MSLEGLQAGDPFSFGMTSGESYGEHTDEAIIELDKSIFEVDGMIDEELVTVGNQITMQDNEGNPLDGIVLEITDDKVIMDFNHPLAGLDLFFSGEILDVREASSDEIAHGHAHGVHGHHH
jgi:FKBP-type peptidyl-prolyl cis-trans isomerase SlyD